MLPETTVLPQQQAGAGAAGQAGRVQAVTAQAVTAQARTAQARTAQAAAAQTVAAAEPTRQSVPERRESWLRGLLGLTVLLALLGGAYLWANTQIYTPQALVQRHLEALQSGNLAEALAIAPHNTANGNAVPLDNSATELAAGGFTAATITAVQEHEDGAKVTATVTVAGQQQQLEYELRRDKLPVAGIFDNWVIPRFDYPVVEFVVPASASLFEVNGQEFDLTANGNVPSDAREETTVRFITTPGDYTFKPLARTAFVTVSGQQVFHYNGSGFTRDEAASEAFAITVTEAGQAEIIRLANAQIDQCMTQNLSVPEGCAVEAWTYVAYTNGHWTLHSYPQLVIDTEKTTFYGGGDSGQGATGSAVFDFRYTDGTPSSKQVQVYGDGYYSIMPDHTLQIAFNRS